MSSDAGAASPAAPVGPSPDRIPPGLTRGLLIAEVLLVFALSLGRSGVYAVVDFIADLTNKVALSSQSAVLNGSRAPGRPELDLILQLLAIAFALTPVFLVAYLLHRSGESLRSIGLDRTELRRDALRGAVLAALIGGSGLALYLVAYHSGANLTVVAEDLPDVWWRIPVLVLSAVQNALLEEVVVVGYLMRRLRQLGWGPRSTLVTSALVRGSYHLYQGVGGFVGNAVMGLVFGKLYQRWGRVAPLLVAHALIDTVAFVGYALLAGHVSWLPTP